MPRVARIYYPGGVFHLISRFFEKRFMLNSAEDRRKYLGLMAQTLTVVDAKLMTYCLMSSHVHMVVRAGSDPLERLMRPINTGFAVWKNRQLGDRIGPVFAGRYKAILVDEDAYLLELVSYVHNNPVRAGLVSSAGESDWSSHRAYVRMEECPQWLNTGFVLGMVGGKPKSAAATFDSYVYESRLDERVPALSGESQQHAAKISIKAVGDGWRLSDSILGDEQFAEKVQQDIAEMDEAVVSGTLDDVRTAHHLGPGMKERPPFENVVEMTCEELGISRVEFEERPKSRKGILARRLIVLLWVQRYRGTQAEVARGLKVLSSKVSRWYATAIAHLEDLEPLVDKMEMSLAEDKLAFVGTSSGKVCYSLKINDDTK